MKNKKHKKQKPTLTRNQVKDLKNESKKNSGYSRIGLSNKW